MLSTLLIISGVFSKFSNNITFLDNVTLKEDSSSKSGMFAIMVENDDGEYEEYTDSNVWPTGMVFNEENSGCVDASGNTINAAISYSDGYVSVSTNDTVYCYLYFDIYELNCVDEGVTSLSECILRSENNFQTEDAAITYIKSKGTPSFSSTATTDAGLYYATDDYGDSYYFRGAVTDNYVYFAGYYWRIIRINGDGSIRMIYDGTSAYDNGTSSTDRYISTSAFNSTRTHNIYVGYMYDENYIYADGGVSDDTTTKTLQIKYYYATNYTFDTETGYYTLTDGLTQELWSSDLVGYYTCNSTSTTCTTMYKIDSYYSNYQAKAYTYSRTSSTDENDVTTYAESVSTSTSTRTLAYRYYYATDYTFNQATGYVLSSPTYAVYDGTDSLNTYYTCGSTSYSGCSAIYRIDSVSTDTDAVVYTYTRVASTYEETHQNSTNSTIKTVVDNWYATNIYNETDGTNSYDDYISDTLFCNDRSLYSGTGTGTTKTYYGANNRLYNANPSPILTCPQQNDAFTVDDEVNGNGDLTYKVGLITADEVAMAGGRYGTSNSSYYLYIGSSYWTMSPSNFYSTHAYAYEFEVYLTGSFGEATTNYSFGVRPVVNLSSSIILISGDGAKDSPYEVALQ